MPTAKSSNMNSSLMARVSPSQRTPRRSMSGMEKDDICKHKYKIVTTTYNKQLSLNWAHTNTTFSHIFTKFTEMFRGSQIVNFSITVMNLYFAVLQDAVFLPFPPLSASLQVVCELAFPARHWGSVSGPAERLQWGYPSTSAQILWRKGAGGTAGDCLEENTVV